jgi:hypothetical protein
MENAKRRRFLRLRYSNALLKKKINLKTTPKNVVLEKKKRKKKEKEKEEEEEGLFLLQGDCSCCTSLTPSLTHRGFVFSSILSGVF